MFRRSIHLLEARGVAGREFQRRQLFGFRGLDHLQAVLVGAGEEEHVLAVEPLKARQRVGRDRLIGVADMRHAVRIGDRGRDVEGCCVPTGPAVLRRCGRFALGAGLDGLGSSALAWRRRWLVSALLALRRRLLARPFATCAFLRRLSSPTFLAVFFAAVAFSWPPSWPSSPRAWLSSRAFSAPTPWRCARAAICAAFFAFVFLAVFFLAVATTNSFIAQTRLSGMITGGALSASPPQAARTPRKPAVFAQDCILRCRARRG